MTWRFLSNLSQLSNWYRLCPLGSPSTFCDFADPFQYCRVVVSVTAFIAYTHGNVFKHHESVLVFEYFLLYQLLFDCTPAIFTTVSIHIFYPSMLRYRRNGTELFFKKNIHYCRLDTGSGPAWWELVWSLSSFQRKPTCFAIVTYPLLQRAFRLTFKAECICYFINLTRHFGMVKLDMLQTLIRQ